MFRVEGELGYKYAKLSRATISRAALGTFRLATSSHRTARVKRVR